MSKPNLSDVETIAVLALGAGLLYAVVKLVNGGPAALKQATSDAWDWLKTPTDFSSITGDPFSVGGTYDATDPTKGVPGTNIDANNKIQAGANSGGANPAAAYHDFLVQQAASSTSGELGPSGATTEAHEESAP